MDSICFLGRIAMGFGCSFIFGLVADVLHPGLVWSILGNATGSVFGVVIASSPDTFPRVSVILLCLLPTIAVNR
jgi:hypothetical protein